MLIVFWLLNQVDGKWPLTENCVAEINGWRTPTRSCWRGLPRTHTLSDTSEKILLKPRKTCVYRCSYHWVSRSFSLPASLNLKEQTRLLKSFFFNTFCTDWVHTGLNTCTTFTFWWCLGREHFLLLSFGSRVHSGGRRVVVGRSVVHVRAGSPDVHTWKKGKGGEITSATGTKEEEILIWHMALRSALKHYNRLHWGLNSVKPPTLRKTDLFSI